MKFVLRPAPILPQTPLLEALCWIAFGTFPENFIDINDEYTPAEDYMSIVASDLKNIDDQWMQKHNTSMFDVILNKNELNEFEKVTHKLFIHLLENRIALYGIILQHNQHGRAQETSGQHIWYRNPTLYTYII